MNPKIKLPLLTCLTYVGILSAQTNIPTKNGKVETGTTSTSKQSHIKENNTKLTSIKYDKLYVADFLKVGNNSLWLNSSQTTGNENRLFSTNGPLVVNGVHSANGSVAASAGQNTIINPDTGNMGVGVPNPHAKLDIRMNETNFFAQSGLRLTTPFTFPQNNNLESLFQIRREGATPNTFSSYLTVNPNGNTGIGITEPKSKLHVHDGRIQITGNNSNGGPMMIFGGDENAPNGQWGIEYASGNVSGLNFWKPLGSSNGSGGSTFGNHFMFLADNGKVSIGLDPNFVNTNGKETFEGDYKLYVGTGILTEKVRITVRSSEDWADYVFRDDYNLLPLNDVEKHIEEKGHLPNVPSAEDVAKFGIDVAKMDAKLLEKIEELTLYVIQLKKENEDIKKLLDKKVNK